MDDDALMAKLMAAFDDDVLDAWEYLSGKLPALLDSQSKD